MIVSFDTQELRNCCSSLRAAEARFGASAADELITMLAEAEVFENANDFIEFRSPESSAIGDSIQIKIGEVLKVQFVAVGTKIERNEKSEIIWNSVRRLKMTEAKPC